jgi:hypothetical protein
MKLALFEGVGILTAVVLIAILWKNYSSIKLTKIYFVGKNLKENVQN